MSNGLTVCRDVLSPEMCREATAEVLSLSRYGVDLGHGLVQPGFNDDFPRPEGVADIIRIRADDGLQQTLFEESAPNTVDILRRLQGANFHGFEAMHKQRLGLIAVNFAQEGEVIPTHFDYVKVGRNTYPWVAMIATIAGEGRFELLSDDKQTVVAGATTKTTDVHGFLNYPGEKQFHCAENTSSEPRITIGVQMVLKPIDQN